MAGLFAIGSTRSAWEAWGESSCLLRAGFVPQGGRTPRDGTPCLQDGQAGGEEISASWLCGRCARGREMKGRHVVSQSCWNRWPGRHQPELCAQSRSPHKVRAVSLQPVEEMKGNNEASALPFVN